MATEEESEIVFSLFEKNLKSIGIVAFSFKINGIKRYFIFPIVLMSLFLFFAKGFSIWILLMPFVPIILLWMLYIIDLNIMVQSLVRIQKTLMREYNLVFDMNELFDFLQQYAESQDKFQIGRR